MTTNNKLTEQELREIEKRAEVWLERYEEYAPTDSLALLGHIRALEAEREWVSVKDRLPDEGTYVVVYKSISRDDDSWHSIASYVRQKSGWFTPHGFSVGEIVTYWQPLPLPPKEEGGK